ncbi:hypothetical protein H072_1730 [Dactylellina haptotyla CBS 200.50]|uniref:Rab-GAP TBC domain-containing protein n=1 Tax=Dactylellina haptotyla (strain CBS 200.50) TaxID=1284197 RepID=S8ATI8_DACHA|nr:hypothetical protein H072_1730 [Dactylellina haptotyla CBS 200.50]
MKDIRQVREQWAAYLRSISSFEALQAASLSDLNVVHGLGHDALRSLLWKSLLLCHKLDLSTLIAAVRKERSVYDAHKAKYLRTRDQDPDQFAGSDPLADDESGPWASLRHDEQLRDEIQKDIDRTYPDTQFFRSADVQITLSNVLFVWSRLHPDVSYRQGMHELAAPVYWVVHADAIEEKPLEITDDGFTPIPMSAARIENEDVMRELLDAKYIEHDTFSLFQKIMLFAKSWYEMGQGEEKTVGGVPTTSPIIRKSEYIHEGLLGAVDPELAYHLDQLGILPQIFLIRWIRLMFGREFTFDETLGLWDGIFVEDPTLQIVDYISIAMMLRIRWKLLEADYTTALTLLLRYEPPSSPPLTLLKDAIHLRDDLSTGTASRLITKHTTRQPTQDPQPYTRTGTPPPSTATAALLSSPRLTGIENLVHDVASRMRDRSERWGVNRALRDAMGEVRRVSAGVGEQQREIYKRWTDSMERQTVLGAILEESIKVLESNITTNSDDNSKRYKDAIERVKYVRTCLLDSRTTLDRRYLKEIPDTAAVAPADSSSSPPSSPRRQISSIPPLSPTSPPRVPSITNKPPPFPTYFHASNNTPAELGGNPAPAATSTTTTASSTINTTITTTDNSKSNTQPPPLAPSAVIISSASPVTPTTDKKSKGLPLWKPPQGAASHVRSVSETPPLPLAALAGITVEPKPRRSLAQSQFAWMLGDDTLDRNRGGFIGGNNSVGSKSLSFSGPTSPPGNAGNAGRARGKNDLFGGAGAGAGGSAGGSGSGDTSGGGGLFDGT